MNEAAMTFTAGQASETAQTIARLVPSLTDETLQQLHDLLAHSVAAPSPAERREAHLGLVVDLIAKGTGEVPTPGDYNRVRAEREAAGEKWPTIEQLSTRYGHWVKVVSVAFRLQRDSGHARIQNSPRAQALRPSYQREEILTAIRRFHRWHSTWPTPWEYLEWAELERLNARRHGHPDPRLPGMKQIRKQYGTFDAAVRAAERWQPNAQ